MFIYFALQKSQLLHIPSQYVGNTLLTLFNRSIISDELCLEINTLAK